MNSSEKLQLAGLFMEKRALSYWDEKGAYERFDPLWYDENWEDKQDDPEAIANLIEHFIDVSKEEGYTPTLYGDNINIGGAKPKEFLNKLRDMSSEGTKLSDEDYRDWFPAYYSVGFPRSVTRTIKRDPDNSDVWPQPAIIEALRRYDASGGKGSQKSWLKKFLGLKDNKLEDNKNVSRGIPPSSLPQNELRVHPALRPISNKDLDVVIDHIESQVASGKITEDEGLELFRTAMWG